MFTKYLDKFQKAEAEWVLEILDLNGGNYSKARQSVMEALNRLTKKAPPVAELKDFDDCIAAAFFASSDWWLIGMHRLAELGLFTMPEHPTATHNDQPAPVCPICLHAYPAGDDHKCT